MICTCCENKPCSVRDLKDCPRCGGSGVEPLIYEDMNSMYEPFSDKEECIKHCSVLQKNSTTTNKRMEVVGDGLA